MSLTKESRVLGDKLIDEKCRIHVKNIQMCEKLSSKKKRMILDKLEELDNFIAKIEELDLDLNDALWYGKQSHLVIPETEFRAKLNEIDNDSLIIYIKKAQLFKVYNPEGFEDFKNDNNTMYRKPYNGPVYEVVRDSHPQKLIISISDEIRDDRLQDIKKHLLEFTHKYPNYSHIKASDLKVYSNDNNTEFMMSGVKMEDLKEKDDFIESLVLFMQNKNNEIANKIQLRPPLAMEGVGVRLYKIPDIKTLVEDTAQVDLLDQLITTTSNKYTTPVINNIYININSNNNVNSNNSVVQNNIKNINNVNSKAIKAKKSIKTFYKHIYDTKPDWYKEGELVNFSIIEDVYRKYFNDNEISATMISRKLNGGLFIKGNRSSNTTKKRLMTYDVLLTSC
jgi:hypothetical protein